MTGTVEVTDKRKTFRIGNYLTFLVFFILGIVAIVSTLLFYEYRSEYTLGPGFLVFWIGVLLLIGSSLLLIQIRKGSYDESDERIPTKPEIIRLLFFLVLTISVLLLIKLLGMNLIIFLFFLFTLKFARGNNWKRAFFTAVVGALSMYFIFVFLFNVHFPKGILGF